MLLTAAPGHPSPESAVHPQPRRSLGQGHILEANAQILVGHERLRHRPHRGPNRRVGPDATRVRRPMIHTNNMVLPLGPMPTAVANQQSATADPFKPRHSDAFAH